MWATLKTILLVSLVTLLVWLWAEAESLSTELISPRIEVVGGSDLLVRSGDETWTGVAQVRARGAKLAVERLQELLRQPVRFTPGVGGVPAQPGSHTLDLRAALRDHPAWAKLGVTIDEVSPPSLSLVIERVVERTLPIRLDARGLELDGEPQISPPTASIRITESAAGRLAADSVVTAVIDEQAIAALQPDLPQTLRARLVPGPGLNGSSTPIISPATAQVTLRTRGLSRSATFNGVPVSIVLPPDQINRWDVEPLDPLIASVAVTGRPELVRALEDPRSGYRLTAYVVLSLEELQAGIKDKPAMFSLTPTDLRFAPERPLVRLKITPRPAGGS